MRSWFFCLNKVLCEELSCFGAQGEVIAIYTYRCGLLCIDAEIAAGGEADEIAKKVAAATRNIERRLGAKCYIRACSANIITALLNSPNYESYQAVHSAQKEADTLKLVKESLWLKGAGWTETANGDWQHYESGRYILIEKHIDKDHYVFGYMDLLPQAMCTDDMNFVLLWAAAQTSVAMVSCHSRRTLLLGGKERE